MYLRRSVISEKLEWLAGGGEHSLTTKMLHRILSSASPERICRFAKSAKSLTVKDYTANKPRPVDPTSQLPLNPPGGCRWASSMPAVIFLNWRQFLAASCRTRAHGIRDSAHATSHSESTMQPFAPLALNRPRPEAVLTSRDLSAIGLPACAYLDAIATGQRWPPTQSQLNFSDSPKPATQKRTLLTPRPPIKKLIDASFPTQPLRPRKS